MLSESNITSSGARAMCASGAQWRNDEFAAELRNTEHRTQQVCVCSTFFRGLEVPVNECFV